MFKKLLTAFTFLFVANFMIAQSIGIIGSATPNGWDSDTDMTQDMVNTDLWTINIDLITGEAKFRQDDDWAVNWGAADFPTGVGEQDGANIPVPGGNYDVTFNSATGEYSFTYTGTTFASIGVIGDATPNGWDSDTNMIQDPISGQVWTLELELVAGGVKFRADDDWTDNWGSLDWPAGVGTPGGDNIPAMAGNYLITFNTATGEYSFETLIAEYNTIGLIGDATPGGWADDTDLTKNPNNSSLWSGNITLTDGEAKFRAEDDWAVNWGGADFPAGIGEQDGPNIPVVAGEYNVNFNSHTGEYSFDPPIKIFNTIGIIGNGTANGWDSDTDMYVDEANPDQWSIQITLVDGELKFRAEDDWAVNWGDDGFPTGTGMQDGPNIPVFAGTWEIKFNATSGEYSFTPVTIGIIGTALVNGWDSDEDLDCSATEGNVWTTTKTLMEAECKFRQDDDWAINWGAADFPTGIGTQDGPNIPITAGTYDISINTGTGEYNFSVVDNTTEVLDRNAVKVFPNPASTSLNVVIENEALQNDLTVHMMDATGRVLKTYEYDNIANLTLDLSEFDNGVYILHLSNEKYIVGKRVVITK